MFMILYTVQVTGLQLRDPAPFNDLLLGLADILYEGLNGVVAFTVIG